MLDEFAVLLDQNVLDQVGVMEEEDIARSEPGPDHVSILADASAKRSQAIARKFTQVAEGPVLHRAGNARLLEGRGHGCCEAPCGSLLV